MGGETLSNHYTIKNSARVRKGCRLDCQGADTSSVRGIGCSKVWLYDILHTKCEPLVTVCDKVMSVYVIGTISSAIIVLLPKKSRRGML